MPISSASAARRRSRVQSVVPGSNKQLARSEASTYPMPRLKKRRSLMRTRTSETFAIGNPGSRSRRPNTSFRFFREPRAISATTNAWQVIVPAESRPKSFASPFLKWSIQIEVSARITQRACGGALPQAAVPYRPTVPAAWRFHARSGPSGLRGEVRRARAPRLIARLYQVVDRLGSQSFAWQAPHHLVHKMMLKLRHGKVC